MITVPVKPMSQNKAFLGRKTKSKEYRVYEGNVMELLPPLDVPEGQLKLTLDVYYSNRAADIDNCLKPFIDILQKEYGFNDNKIYKLDVEKFIVKKGEEKLEFRLDAYTPSEEEEEYMYKHLYTVAQHKLEEAQQELESLQHTTDEERYRNV